MAARWKMGFWPNYGHVGVGLANLLTYGTSEYLPLSVVSRFGLALRLLNQKKLANTVKKKLPP